MILPNPPNPQETPTQRHQPVDLTDEDRLIQQVFANIQIEQPDITIELVRERFQHAETAKD